MKTLKLLVLLATTTYGVALHADCAQECDDTYAECKAVHNSPNGDKVCGSDYRECKTRCAESGE